MSFAASNTPNRDQLSQYSSSPPKDAELRDEDAWSGEEADGGDDHNYDHDHDEDGDLRKRKRLKTARPLSVSCELCKTRKVKCDRGQPQCGWCARNGQPCEYKERKKPGLRAGYGRELEARLDKLEGVSQAQQQLIQQLVSQLPSNQPGRTATIPPSTASLQHVPNNDSFLYSHLLDVPPSQHLKQPSNREYLQRQHHRQQSKHFPAAENETHIPPDPPVESPSLNVTSSTQDHIISGNYFASATQEQDFPLYDLLYALTDLFFKHINTWCPLLHRKTTLDSLFGQSAFEEADRIILHAIVVATLRFSKDERLTDQLRRRYYSTSKQKVLLYGLETSSVKALQALVILTLDIVGTSNGPAGWNVLAVMTRSAVQLGLAVEATSACVAPIYPSISTLRAVVLPEPTSFIEDEARRRLFWMIYVLDRYATIATAFEFALDDKEIDRRLPCRDDLFGRNEIVETRWFKADDRYERHREDNPETLGSFTYYIEVLGILSEIHRFLKRPVDIGALSDIEQWQQEYRSLDNKLTSWKFNLPGEYSNMSRLFNANGSDEIVNCVWIMLHVTYHTTVIRLHSSAAYPTMRSPIFAPSFSASQRCRTAVEDICALCTYVRSHDMLTKLGPPFAFSLWVAARLLLVHGSTIDHKVNPAIHPLVETLHEMGVYWAVAERYASLLSRVLDEHHASEAAPPDANGVRDTPSTVRILADMRRCAYDLDFLISRQPLAKTPAVTPARAPAPNEFEYLDIFDFFNMPRLPLPAVDAVGSGVASARTDAAELGTGDGVCAAGSNEFNITNFICDVDADWFSKA